MYEKPFPMRKSYPQKLALRTIPDLSHSDNILELKIITTDSGFSARDFSAYFSLIDHIYGRMNPHGFIGYSHSPEFHLKIKKLRRKCLEFIISNLPDKSDIGIIFIIYLFLKYLPHFSNAYQKYEEGRLTRMKRKVLKDKMRKEKEIKALDNKTLNNLIKLQEYFHIQEIRLTPRASRFASLHVKNIKITIASKTESNDNDVGGESESGP